ncbi:HNHc domain containing protein [uncultured Caudovirales phage]|uniref:HNHc domain containing protein n=1 Tax=uncultured Caudovirales phage TaxID=2100421 RepID=A0A6J5PTI1_9CAUD|nr:HNHc domain containing protein [uncultured Caudovirales phage]CAB4173376.1 HNHc domain containing protein [uncultured Caudovirales phage]CAB4179709.1 HNHc domain containing protein [uncultured Caudovirales phage]CAB4203979.1 HNHc domain containing protein [uncultured Caudovirales phage]CAB4215939.1 HNHc domain containing protein [uncultured Caudovirales phage]
MTGAGGRRCLLCTTLVPAGKSRCARHAIVRVRGRANQKRRGELVVGRRCYVCKVAPATQLDHVVRLASGGSEQRSNTRGICDSCHKRKTATEGRRA